MTTNTSQVNSPLRLLAIDDDPEMLKVVTAALSQDGLEIIQTTDPEEGLRLVKRTHPDIVLLDLQMGKLSGMDVLERIVEWAPGTGVIMMTGTYSTESAVDAIKKGAADYLPKPLTVETLLERIERLSANIKKRQRWLQLESESVNVCEFEGMVSRSLAMMEVFDRIQRFAPHFRTALIQGPTGAGKESVARALYKRSPVANGPFIVCNCSAMVEALLESELFGYAKGAFAGVTQDKMGLFEHANGGVLFLDEIGEMSLAMQAKLLRAVQFQSIQRVGSASARQIDVRVIAATHRNLREMAAEKQFREDLFFRLSTVEIQLPRLAKRREDLPLLERLFLRQFARQYGKPEFNLSPQAQSLLANYSWPGNVRELKDAIGHACMLAENETIGVRDLPEHLGQQQQSEEYQQDELLLSLDELQRRHSRRVLESVGGNKAKAAQILKVSRSTLYKILEETEAPRR